jgi:SAM-dependent methyltransferase
MYVKLHNRNSKGELLRNRRTLRSKKFLNLLYCDFYAELKKYCSKGKIIEVGSGAGFIKEIIPDSITSDVIAGPGIDNVFSASDIPYKSSSVASFVMIDVFHHIPDVEKALQEMYRCLKVSGTVVMIEPFTSWWGTIIYKYLHHEDYLPQSNWKLTKSGRVSASNTALPWIVYKRDKQRFMNAFPGFTITELRIHTPLTYLVSGGLTNWQFLPDSSYKIFKTLENILSSAIPGFGMFATIVLSKTK